MVLLKIVSFFGLVLRWRWLIYRLDFLSSYILMLLRHVAYDTYTRKT